MIKLKYVPCGNPDIAINVIGQRYICQDFTCVVLGDRKYCGWCCDKELPGKRRKYCSEDCRLSADAYCHPQGDIGVFLLLREQNCKCNICGFDYSKYFINGPNCHNINYLIFKMRGLLHKNNLHKQYNPEVDHIIPIFKGGKVLGLDNHQVICHTCHILKSAQERRKCQK